jgi:quercetin dioxygenase-like cupin family protein
MAEMAWAAQHLAAAAPMIAPPASLKASVMQRIHANKEEAIDTSATEDFTYQHEDSTSWIPHEHKGVWVKPLATDKERGYSVVLMKMDPGAVYPSHHHDGAEQCYVLAGTANVHGHFLTAGDFHSAVSGSEHGDITTTTGNKLLLVVADEDYQRVYKGVQRNLFKSLLRHPFQTLRSLQH